MRLLFFIATISLLFSACKDPGSIGAGLLENEEFTVNETNFTIPAKVIRGDSTRVNSSVSTKSVGIIDEPVFGETVNQLFMNTSFSIDPVIEKPNFHEASLDSIVLRFNLDEEAHYGDFDAEHLVEVFQMTNPYSDEIEMFGGENITTYTEFEYDESNILGQTNYVTRYDDSITLNLHTSDTFMRFRPQLRIKLDNSFGEIFFADTLNTDTDSVYMSIAKGLVLRSTPSTSSMIGLDFSEVTSKALNFYYTKDSGEKMIYPFNVGTGNQLNVIHEYEGSGSAVEAALNDPSEDQEILYVESYSGSNVEFDLSILNDYRDSIINHASLELTVADVADYDDQLFPVIDNVILSRINEEGELVWIKDIEDLEQIFITEIEADFGGDARTNGLTGEVTYTMNITRHVKEVLDGNYGENTSIILSNAANIFEANRSIIAGNSEDGNAPKLKLVISKP